MPIKSTKPAPGNFSPGTKPLPMVNDFKTEEQLMARVPGVRAEIMRGNSRLLARTQPYNRAAELRGGNAFRMQQEAAMRAENVGNAPYRGFGSTTLGKRRPLPDIGP